MCFNDAADHRVHGFLHSKPLFRCCMDLEKAWRETESNSLLMSAWGGLVLHLYTEGGRRKNDRVRWWDPLINRKLCVPRGSSCHMLIIPAVFYVFIKYGFIIVLRACQEDRGRRWSLWVNKHLMLAHTSPQGPRPGSWLKTSCLMNE